MAHRPLTDRNIFIYGGLFGAWAYGWLATADWLISSGLLARAAGVESALPKVSLLAWVFSKYPAAIPAKFLVNGPLGIGAAAVIAAVAGWACWRAGRLLKMDKESLGLKSVLWATRAVFSPSFFALMLAYASVIAAVFWLKKLTGWPYWILVAGAMAILVVGIPLQLCQARAVSGQTLGQWWIWAKPSRDTALLLPMIVGTGIALTAIWSDYTWAAILAWIISTFFYSAVTTLLIVRTESYSGSWQLVRTVWEWRKLSSWFVQDAVIYCALIAILAPFAAVAYLNIFAVPANVHALRAQGLESPQWFSFCISLVRTTSDYWRTAGVVIVFGPFYAWLALCAGRLAYSQSGPAQRSPS
jgi:hypothetical protein